MISPETFELIQSKRAEHAGQPYAGRQIELDDPRFLIDGTFQDPVLKGLGQTCARLMWPETEDTQLPPDADRYNAIHTTSAPAAEMVSGDTGRLSVFVLRNKPADMGAWVYQRLVVTDKIEADDGLLDEVPVFVTWGRPRGIYAAESPLLYEEQDSEAWQRITMEVFDDLVDL